MCEINALATATGEGNVFCSFKLTLLFTKPNVDAFNVFDVVFVSRE